MKQREFLMVTMVAFMFLTSAVCLARDRGRAAPRSGQRQNLSNPRRPQAPNPRAAVQNRTGYGSAGGYQPRSLPGSPGGARPAVTSGQLEQMREDRQRQQYMQRQRTVWDDRDDEGTRSANPQDDYLYPPNTLTPAAPLQQTR